MIRHQAAIRMSQPCPHKASWAWGCSPRPMIALSPIQALPFARGSLAAVTYSRSFHAIGTLVP
jgi:hypothetical protein